MMVDLKREYKQAEVENELYKVGFEQGKSSAIKEVLDMVDRRLQNGIQQIWCWEFRQELKAKLENPSK